MDKYIKIAIYVAVLFLVSIWISSVVKSCNSSAGDLTELPDGDTESVNDEFEEDFFEDNLGDGSESTYDSDMGGGTVPTDEDYEDVDFDTDYTEVDEALERTTRSTTTVNRSQSDNHSSASTGRYMVLAGSYLIKDNARAMVGKLDNIGYDAAEIVVFNMSQYHSVCAARVADYNEAIRLSNELKRRGIDSYVHTKH